MTKFVFLKGLWRTDWRGLAVAARSSYRNPGKTRLLAVKGGGDTGLDCLGWGGGGV